VERQSFATLDEAVAAMERRADRIRAEGPLDEVHGVRDYEPSERVHARLELSAGGLFRGREAGLDVMGDGALVPYVGVVRKRKLDVRAAGSAFDAVRDAML
jgi:hypothetical protein